MNDVASLTIRLFGDEYVYDGARWRGADRVVAKELTATTNSFYASIYAPADGPPMNALGRWLRDELPDVRVVSSEDEPYDLQTIY